MATNGENRDSDTTERAGDELQRDGDIEPASENTPLLSSSEAAERDRPSEPQRQTSAISLLRHLRGSSSKTGKRRWPSLLALLLLCIVVIFIIVFAFIAPSAVEQYAEQAVVFEPVSLSIDSLLDSGVRARVVGDLSVDSSRVHRKSVRDLGRFCTWIATWAETGPSKVEVILPEYGNVLLGSADVPGIKVYIRDGHTTRVDFLTDLRPGDVDGIRAIANDFIDDRLGQLRVLGKARVSIKSGLLTFGEQSIQREIVLAGDDLHTIPSYEIKKLMFREIDVPTGRAMAADVSISVQNDYPVDFTIPPLGFGILVDNCQKSDQLIVLGDALTKEIRVQSKSDVEVNVTGTVRELPPVLTQFCPGTDKSPLDTILGRYMRGKTNTVYVQGSDSPSTETPGWITDIMSDITVPIPVQGRAFGHLIKNFSLTDTHFNLPDGFAEPGTPESHPRLSANVRVLVAVPEEMNFNISVDRVRADADVFHEGKKLGRLDLTQWQKANSSRVAATPDEGPAMVVESRVQDAPLEIQDEDVFTDVFQKLLFGKETVVLKVQAEVDVGVETAVGSFAIRKIPASGRVPLKPTSRPSDPPPRGPHHPTDPTHPLPSNLTDRIQPRLVDIRIVNTSSSSLTLAVTVNATNPTDYFATVPYVDLHLLANGSFLGHVSATNLTLRPGHNPSLRAVAHYEPTNRTLASNLLSQYLSGWNSTLLTLQAHQLSFPSNPSLGRALGKVSLSFRPPLPPSSSSPPTDGDGDDDDGSKHRGSPFLSAARFHLFTSSATFRLHSPLPLALSHLRATAFYRSEAAARIVYDEEFDVLSIPEGDESPLLPVDWSPGSVGFDAIRRALGGSLRLDAHAEVDVRIGRWRERVWFRGEGVGVQVRL